MKKYSRRLQTLREKAAQVQQIIESVPPKVADIREALVSTTGQVQQMRADVLAAVAGLQADTEERLLQTLREIDAGAETFREAGFELTGVDMELGLNRRLVARLAWIEEVSEGRLRSILLGCQSQRTVHAMLTAVVQAGRLADKVDLRHLGCEEILVSAGPAPSVRVCWRSTEEEEETPLLTAAASPPTVAPGPAPVAPTPSTPFASSSFFEPRRPVESAPAPAPTLVAASPTPEIMATSTPASPPPSMPMAPAAPGDWRRGALDRFKRMPNLTGTK